MDISNESPVVPPCPFHRGQEYLQTSRSSTDQFPASEVLPSLAGICSNELAACATNTGKTYLKFIAPSSLFGPEIHRNMLKYLDFQRLHFSRPSVKRVAVGAMKCQAFDFTSQQECFLVKLWCSTKLPKIMLYLSLMKNFNKTILMNSQPNAGRVYCSEHWRLATEGTQNTAPDLSAQRRTLENESIDGERYRSKFCIGRNIE